MGYDNSTKYSDITNYNAKVCMLKGESGDTIKGIEKTSSEGLKDTYTITLSNGDKHTFIVENGNGIKSIAKTSTSGLVDTYTITLDNGDTSTFTVKNGDGVNTLKIGGRNLIRNSDFYSGFDKWISEGSMPIAVDADTTYGHCLKVSFSDTYPGQRIFPDVKLNFVNISGKQYTVSFYAKASVATTLITGVVDGYNKHEYNLTTDWEYFAATYTATSTGSLSFYIKSKPSSTLDVYLANVKAELGNQATDWTPAPEDMDDKISKSVLSAYPIGSIYMSVNRASPATLFGGTWESLGGRFLLGADSTYTAGATGGEATHALTMAEMPAHKHNLSDDSRAHSFYWGMKDADVHVGVNASGGAGTDNNLGTKQTDWATTGTTGKGAAHNNMPPYLVVYMWKRTA